MSDTTYRLGKRGGSPNWYIIWSEGRRSFRRSTGTQDRHHAELVLAAFILERKRPNATKPAEFGIVQVLNWYDDEHASRRASAEQARIAIAHLTRFYGTATVDAINQASHDEYERRRRAEGVSWQTINRERMVLRAALNHAKRHHGLLHVPHVPAIPPDAADNRPVEPRGRPLSLPELARLYVAAQSEHMRMFILILMGTMCRPDAARDLTMAQVDLDHGLIDLNPPGRAQTKKYRPTVPMPAFLRRALRKIKGGHVLQYHGAPIASTKTAWRELRRNAGLDPKVNPYSIRHTMSRELRRRRVPSEQISLMLGHRPVDVRRTDLIYAPYEPGYCRDAKRAIEQIHAAVMAEARKVARQWRASAPAAATGRVGKNADFMGLKVVGATGIEPVTPTMSR